MRSLRVDIMLPIPLPDAGTEMDPTLAFQELSPAVRARCLTLKNSIAAAVADARTLGPMEPAKATMHVCLHDPNGSQQCGPEVEIH